MTHAGAGHKQLLLKLNALCPAYAMEQRGEQAVRAAGATMEPDHVGDATQTARPQAGADMGHYDEVGHNKAG